MTVVGDKQLLATETLLLADDEIGAFTVPMREADGSDARPLRVAVRFTAPDASDASARWGYDHGVLRMVFSGWADREGAVFEGHNGAVTRRAFRSDSMSPTSGSAT